MKFRHITRQLTSRVSRASRSALISQPTFYRFQAHKFSSNLDPSTKNETIKKVSELQESIQNNLKTTMKDTSSFWTLTALDNEHKEWIEEYNKALAKYQICNYDIKNFNDISSWFKYIGSNAFDGIQRWRMCALKNVICYEEFMIGAMNAFKSIQTLNEKDEMKISRCFTSKLYDQVPQIKNALFDTAENENKYILCNMIPFANRLHIGGLYNNNNNNQQAELEYLEMCFKVRYYYSLKNIKNETDIKQKYADIEWLGMFEPEIHDNKFKTFNLCDKGFLVNDVEVDSF